MYIYVCKCEFLLQLYAYKLLTEFMTRLYNNDDNNNSNDVERRDWKDQN